jgi:hypothetical protein
VTFFYLLVSLALLLLVALFLSLWAAWRRRRTLPYRLQPTLLSPEETAFLVVLDEAVGTDYRVFGKVRVGDLVSVRRGVGKRPGTRSFAQLGDLKVDFLVCRRGSASLVCAVQLVGRGSRQRHGRAADKALVRSCDALGLPLVRVPEAETYSAKGIAEQIYTAIYVPKVKVPAAGPQGRRGDDGLSQADEEHALSVLAAAIREGDPLPRLRAS